MEIINLEDNLDKFPEGSHFTFMWAARKTSEGLALRVASRDGKAGAILAIVPTTCKSYDRFKELIGEWQADQPEHRLTHVAAMNDLLRKHSASVADKLLDVFDFTVSLYPPKNQDLQERERMGTLYSPMTTEILHCEARRDAAMLINCCSYGLLRDDLYRLEWLIMESLGGDGCDFLAEESSFVRPEKRSIESFKQATYDIILTTHECESLIAFLNEGLLWGPWRLERGLGI